MVYIPLYKAQELQVVGNICVVTEVKTLLAITKVSSGLHRLFFTWCSLVSRPLPDFILEPRLRDKIWAGPGDEANRDVKIASLATKMTIGGLFGPV